MIGGGGIGQIYGICTADSKMRNRNYDPDGFGFDKKEYFVTYNNIMDIYNNPAEFFPKNLVAFGRDRGGNKICFDYRLNPTTDNPPVVYWIKGYEPRKYLIFSK